MGEGAEVSNKGRFKDTLASLANLANLAYLANLATYEVWDAGPKQLHGRASFLIAWSMSYICMYPVTARC